MSAPQSLPSPTGGSPPDVGDVGAPLQVGGDGLEADEEAREEQDGDGGDGTHKGGHLGSTAAQTRVPKFAHRTPPCDLPFHPGYLRAPS